VFSEYLQFAAAMVLMVAILIGSYWFVIYSPKSPSASGRAEHRQQQQREGDEGGRRSDDPSS
jgi:hypothetical protein